MYVHHFVLYDIGARGYVGPFYLAFIMDNYSELLSVLDQIMRYFCTVSLLFHFGNTITFFHDIVTRLQYLKRLKTVVDEESFELYADDQLLAMSQKNSVTDTAIDDQVKQLLLVKKSFAEYLEKDIFQEHRNLFNEKCLEALENEKKCDRLCREPTQATVHISTNDHYKITIRAEGVVLILHRRKKVIIHSQNMVIHHIMMVGFLF